MPKIAIAHDWIIDVAGAEKALRSIYRVFPSDVYTLVAKPASVEAIGIKPANLHTSLLQILPKITRYYRSLLYFLPWFVERFNFSAYETVISSSHSVIKGIRTRPDQLHICYCYSPMRYVWDLRAQYLKESGLDKGLMGKVAQLMLNKVGDWDYATRNRPQHYVAISKFIAARIKKVYGRESTVIYPPVDVDTFTLTKTKEDFYLTASRMVPYKKINLIVEAFSAMPDKRLVVIGAGPDAKKIARIAGPNVQLMGYQPQSVLRDHMQRARAFVFAAEEDFGIIPVEAQACGTPVIAYGEGGSLETVADQVSGVFFKEQTVASLTEAVNQFEERTTHWDPVKIRAQAERFARPRFEKEFKEFVEGKIAEFQGEAHARRTRS